MTFTRLNQIPFAHDIAPSDLWIPPTLGIMIYILPGIIGRAFPLTPDNGPFSAFHYRIADYHHNYIKFKRTKLYRFIHVDLKDNLHFLIFLVAASVLKNENKCFRGEKLLLMTVVLTGCALATNVRNVTNRTLLTCARELEERRLTQSAQLCEKIASLIKPSIV